jgi:hypothetical protein
VIAQADPTTNGIYDAQTGAWTRSGDMSGDNQVVQGTLVVVFYPNAVGLVYQLVTQNPIPGTTALNFSAYNNLNPNFGFGITPDEADAFVAPVNLLYWPGDIRRYGGDPTGVNDSTAAILACAQLQAVAQRAIIVDGTFLYTPTARLDVQGTWYGFGKVRSVIKVNTGAYNGDYFRVTGHSVFRDITVQAVAGETGVGTGIYLSADTGVTTGDNAFTGDIRISGVQSIGFNIGIEIGNVYDVIVDRSDFTGNNYGEYCVPNPAGGGFCNTVQHLNCNFQSNGVNVYFNPSVNCNEVSYMGCAIEDATGTTLVDALTMNAYFANVATLRLISTYIEGSVVTYAFFFASVANLYIAGMINEGTSSILIAPTNAVAHLDEVASSGPLLAGGALTPVNLFLSNSSLPAAGNTFNGPTSIILNTSINTAPSTTKVNQIGFGLGVNGNSAPAQSTGWGTPVGAAVIDNYNITDAGGANSNTNKALAQIIAVMKAVGFLGA